MAPPAVNGTPVLTPRFVELLKQEGQQPEHAPAAPAAPAAPVPPAREAAPQRRSRGVPRWPLWLIASPAAVAVWSGWVALGGMCGFGEVNLLPGIGRGFNLNTAITLPVGVEAYGAYALGAWLTPGTPEQARVFARWSALGALVLGMCGQVVYHLLAAAHEAKAPWPVVVAVGCMPVVTLGFGAALTHLLRVAPEHAPDAAPDLLPEQDAGTVPEQSPPIVRSSTAPAPGPAPRRQPARSRSSSRSRPRTAAQSISDADLKQEIRVLLQAAPDLSAASAARQLKRSRNRVGPLLEEARREQPDSAR